MKKKIRLDLSIAIVKKRRSGTFITCKKESFLCSSVVLRPTGEYFAYTGTFPLPLKGCKF